MTTFDKREDAYEKKFAHDEELRFKANARRNKLLGLWAAEKLGKSGDDVEAYAKDWERPPFELTQDETNFYARGSTDNKFGIAQLTSTFIRLNPMIFWNKTSIYSIIN